MSHNWSATKQRLHPQNVAEISRHSVLSGDRIDNMRHRLHLSTRTHISVCKSPFSSAGTAVSLFRAKTFQQRPLLPREVETWLTVSASDWLVCEQKRFQLALESFTVHVCRKWDGRLFHTTRVCVCAWDHETSVIEVVARMLYMERGMSCHSWWRSLSATSFMLSVKYAGADAWPASDSAAQASYCHIV